MVATSKGGQCCGGIRRRGEGHTCELQRDRRGGREGHRRRWRNAIVLGALSAAMRAVGRLRRDEPNNYRRFRQQLGRSILLGLELLVAADIIRTVAVTPTLTSVAVLAGIVVIRTFLSFSLELEITGRWPWQKQPPEATS